jgi:hypothetical protein
MRALFRDDKTQERFEKDGYAVITLLSDQEVRILLDLYRDTDHGEINDSLYVSSNTTKGPEFARRIYEAMKAAVAKRTEEHFDNCRIITGSFLVKKPNPKNRILPHQDWTVVDESQYSCASIWTALTDVELENGALGTIAGSHKFFSQILYSPATWSHRRLPYAQHLSALFPYLAFHAVKAGQAIVFDSRIIHGSLANTSSAFRMTASIGIAPAEATLHHHYLLPGTSLAKFETFEVSEDFFWRFNNTSLSALHDQGRRPEGLKSLGVRDVADFSVAPISAERMVEMVEAAGNRADRSLGVVDGSAIFGRA